MSMGLAFISRRDICGELGVSGAEKEEAKARLEQPEDSPLHHSSLKDHKARALLRNPVALRETIQQLAPTGLTSFEDTAIKGFSVELPQGIFLSKAEVDKIDTAATKLLEAGREWIGALKQVGAGKDEESLKALVAVATENIIPDDGSITTRHYALDAGVATLRELQTRV